MRVFLAALAFYLYYKWDIHVVLALAYWVSGGTPTSNAAYTAAWELRRKARKLARSWGADQ